MGYLAVLVLAAGWAANERTRVALAGHTRWPAQIRTPLDLDGDSGLDDREGITEGEAPQLLVSA